MLSHNIFLLPDDATDTTNNCWFQYKQNWMSVLSVVACFSGRLFQNLPRKQSKTQCTQQSSETHSTCCIPPKLTDSWEESSLRRPTSVRGILLPYLETQHIVERCFHSMTAYMLPSQTLAQTDINSTALLNCPIMWGGTYCLVASFGFSSGTSPMWSMRESFGWLGAVTTRTTWPTSAFMISKHFSGLVKASMAVYQSQFVVDKLSTVCGTAVFMFLVVCKLMKGLAPQCTSQK